MCMCVDATRCVHVLFYDTSHHKRTYLCFSSDYSLRLIQALVTREHSSALVVRLKECVRGAGVCVRTTFFDIVCEREM